MRRIIFIFGIALIGLPGIGIASSATASAVADSASAKATAVAKSLNATATAVSATNAKSTAESVATTNTGGVKQERTKTPHHNQPAPQTASEPTAAVESSTAQPNTTISTNSPTNDTPVIIAQAIDDGVARTITTNVSDESKKTRRLIVVAITLLSINTLLLVSLLFVVSRASKPLPLQRF